MPILSRRFTLAAGLAAALGWPSLSAAQAMNTLTPAEQRAGWKLLFNGRDLTGWRGYKKPAPPGNWSVEDGAITLNGVGSDLMTDAEYGPFELTFDWKISKNGNSGVIYLIKETDAPNTYNTGPEYQVLDNDGHSDGKFPLHRAGAIYDLVVPKEGLTKPVGEWNQGRIVVRKDKIEHWLNGQLAAQSSYGDEAWRKLVAGSKFKTMDDFGKAASGHISLQYHGDRVWYRNIKIRKL